MARIKSTKYEIDGREIEVNFNCSSSGVFSTNLNMGLVEKLGLEKARLEGKSLSEIEDTINKAFIAYKEANTTYKLKIAILFGASGEFTKTPEGYRNKKFDINDDYRLRAAFSSIESMIGLDYKVIVEENRDGRIRYHDTMIAKNYRGELHPWHINVNGYITVGSISGRSYKMIDYTETALENIKSITMQMQKASAFLVEIISSEDAGLILSSEKFNSLGSGS